jgi:hypothetical protein
MTYTEVQMDKSKERSAERSEEHGETFKFRLPGYLLERLYNEKQRSGVSVAETLRRAADAYLTTFEKSADNAGAVEKTTDRSALMVEKWRSRGIIPDREWTGYKAVALILDSQECHFERIDSAGNGVCAALTDLLGDGYRDIVYKAVCSALETSDIFKVCSVQPASTPISRIMYFQRRPTTVEDGFPTVNLDIKAGEVRAENRRTRGHITRWSVEESSAQYAATAALIEAVWDSMRRLLRKCMENVELYDGRGDVQQAIKLGCETVRQQTERVAPSRFICHPSHARCPLPSDEWEVITDPLFPRDRLLLMRIGESILDAPVVWAPYHFTFIPYSEDEIAVGIRDSTTVVDGDSFHLIGV